MDVQRELGFLWQALRLVLFGFDVLQDIYRECEQNRQLPPICREGHTPDNPKSRRDHGWGQNSPFPA